MTDGLFIGNRRPASKKALKEAIAENPANVFVESTSSAFGFPSFSGSLDTLPAGTTVTFVGPDPYRDRRFYGTISRGARGIVVK